MQVTPRNTAAQWAQDSGGALNTKIVSLKEQLTEKKKIWTLYQILPPCHIRINIKIGGWVEKYFHLPIWKICHSPKCCLGVTGNVIFKTLSQNIITAFVKTSIPFSPIVNFTVLCVKKTRTEMLGWVWVVLLELGRGNVHNLPELCLVLWNHVYAGTLGRAGSKTSHTA